jgi:hypothetical protein
MARGGGAKSVEAGGLLRVRDVSAMRVRALNTAALHTHVLGEGARLRAELDQVGNGLDDASDGDGRSLLARTLGILYAMAKNEEIGAGLRWRAAKTVAEVVAMVHTEEQRTRLNAAALAQRSEEHVGKMGVEQRKLELEEGRRANGLPSRELLERLAAGAVETDGDPAGAA